MDFQARYILIKPPTPEALSERLQAAGKEDSVVQTVLKNLSADLDETKIGELFDSTIINEALDESSKVLGDFIYKKGDAEMTNGNDDAEMKDVPTESQEVKETTEGS